MHTTRIVSAAAALVFFATSCGGASTETANTASAPDSTAATAPGVDPGTSADTVAGTVAQPSETTAIESTIPSTDAPTTPLPALIEPFNLAALPALITAADAAMTGTDSGASNPFAIVDDIIGFPLQILVPDGSTLQDFDATLSRVNDDGTTNWDARYNVVASGGSVDDIDITLDDNGPGSAQLTDFFDPIFIGLGFERKNSTASDPGDPGGPNSVNHVYDDVELERSVNGVPATFDPIFISSSEDINGWAYDEERPELGGYTVAVGFETATAAAGDATIAPTPFPATNAIMESFPLPDGLTLSDLAISMHPRAADSFGIDRGATVMNLEITWEAGPDALDDIVAFYADLPATFTDESIVMAGMAHSSDDGTIARTEPFIYNGTDTHIVLLWLERYAGRLSITASDDGVEEVAVRLDIEFNPNDLPLALPTE